MEWSSIPQLGTVGILAFLLVELGKRKFPKTFTSDSNVWWSVAVAVTLQAIYTRMSGGDALAMWNSVPQGAAVGLSMSGLYRGIAGSSKRNSLDFTEQATDIVVGNPHELRQAMMAEEDEGETVVRGFTGK